MLHISHAAHEANLTVVLAFHAETGNLTVASDDAPGRAPVAPARCGVPACVACGEGRGSQPIHSVLELVEELSWVRDIRVERSSGGDTRAALRFLGCRERVQSRPIRHHPRREPYILHTTDDDRLEVEVSFRAKWGHRASSSHLHARDDANLQARENLRAKWDSERRVDQVQKRRESVEIRVKCITSTDTGNTVLSASQTRRVTVQRIKPGAEAPSQQMVMTLPILSADNDSTRVQHMRIRNFVRRPVRSKESLVFLAVRRGRQESFQGQHIGHSQGLQCNGTHW